MKPKQKLRDVSFRPGDILVWSGRGWRSRVIALLTCKLSQLFRGQLISHMSICAERRLGLGREGIVENFESTTFCSLPCRIQGTVVSGVQCHDPHAEIARYNGNVWVMRPVREITEEQSHALTDFLVDAIGHGYDHFQAGMSAIPHWIKRWGWFNPDPETLFCDELVNFALRQIDVGPRSFSPSKVTPAWTAWFLTHTYTYLPPDLVWRGRAGHDS